ncbi:hypothetical protein SPFM15_00225 [Salmonella phage SPFM15]|nr:hypothetical protein SPFM5_00220 [Salmonella phage SPFM5]VFR13849.1 hypothetical protein SPFM15_00225 [Salmonella phage SPFM15]
MKELSMVEVDARTVSLSVILDYPVTWLKRPLVGSGMFAGCCTNSLYLAEALLLLGDREWLGTLTIKPQIRLRVRDDEYCLAIVEEGDCVMTDKFKFEMTPETANVGRAAYGSMI